MLQGPSGRIRRPGTSLPPLVDEQQQVFLPQRVQVVPELVVIVPGTAVKNDERIPVAPAALHNVQRRVADVDQPSLTIVMHRGVPTDRAR